jgi:hypothetical protein
MAYDGRLALGEGIDYEDPKNVLSNPFEYSRNQDIVENAASESDNMHQSVIET